MLCDVRSSTSFYGCLQLGIPLRLLCAALLLACNATMWTLFSKALRHCSSSAQATVTTTASNFISSVSFSTSWSPFTPFQTVKPFCFCVYAGSHGKADIRREPLSFVVGGNLSHSVRPADSAQIFNQSPTRGQEI